MNPAQIAADYMDALARRAVTMPREFAGLEGLLTWGLAGAAALFLLVAVLRRSAGAAVSFSLLTLTALIVGIATGRLGFLPPGTAVLILSLYACAVLLFLTSCVRVARDNPVVGAGVLVAILGLVALGGASALGMTDGGRAAGWALVAVAAFAILSVLFDLARGDRAAIALLPGVTAAGLSGAPMLAVSPGSSWFEVALPLGMLAGGTLLATLAAAFVGVPAPQAKPKARRGLAPSYADEHAFFGEVAEPAAPPAPRSAFADAPPPTPEPPARPPARPAAPPLFAPAVIGGAADGSTGRGSHDEDAYGRGAYAPGPLDPPVPATDPASSHWGGVDTVVPRGAPAPDAPAPDAYVWDAMAEPETRAGPDALAALGQRDAPPPEALRGLLDAASLDAFDEDVLGGPNPRTGPFRARLDLAAGGAVVLDGARQVDPDGIPARLSATVAPVGAATPLSARVPAPRLLAPRRRRGDGAAAALDRGEIGAHFQPIVRLAGRETVGFEALARWTRADGGVLEAEDFVPDLVEAGRGLDLAERVADEAARELGAWLAAQPGRGQFVSVNVAATDLDKKGLAALIRRAVDKHALPAGALVVELGEDRIKASPGAAVAAAKAVRQAGASLAVDDFGVGFSNLARLSKFRFDLVKTDRSLTMGAATDKKARGVLKSVIGIAHKAGMPVIAEGIEDEAAAQALEAMGCDFGQGYLFGRPEPASGAAPQVASGLR